jgi:hypothetical protein
MIQKPFIALLLDAAPLYSGRCIPVTLLSPFLPTRFPSLPSHPILQFTGIAAGDRERKGEIVGETNEWKRLCMIAVGGGWDWRAG